MNPRELCREYLTAMKSSGAEKAQCLILDTKKHLMTFNKDRVLLFSAAENRQIQLLAILKGRCGTFSVNGAGETGVESGAAEVVAATASRPADPAYDIAPPQPAESFDNGVSGPDSEKMYRRLEEFFGDMRNLYPKVSIQSALLGFTEENKHFGNTNDVGFSVRSGKYELGVLFSSKEGGKASSFNYFDICSEDLESPLMSWAGVDRLFRQSGEQISTKPIEGKFVGDIVVSPECLGSFLSFVTDDALRDNKLMSGTSVYKDKLGDYIACPELSLSSTPASRTLSGYYFTKDGHKTEDVQIIKEGILESFLVSRYGAAKTSLRHVRNDGGGYVVQAGDRSTSDLISSVERGLLITRFSGANPNENGDFSGVAKNSYYIEKGKVLFPISETMVSGNIPRMLLAIKGISKERVDSGYSVYPWIHFSGITMSGK